MQKNVAGKWIVFAFQDEGGTNPGEPVTGDALNITANVRIDGGAANAVDDTNPTELEDGYYVFDITAAENNGDMILITPQSATANVNVIGVPGAVWTTPANFPAMGIESDGHVHGDVKEMLGDGTTVTDLKDFADAGYDPVTNKVQGVVLVDTTTTNTDMRGTDGANTTTPPTEAAIYAEFTTGSNEDAFKADVSLLALQDKLEAYFQLALRTDSAIATDRATELAEINANEGSGAGTYDNTIDGTAVEFRQEMDANSTQFAAIVADTNELQTDWTNGGRLDLILDDILSDTNELQTNQFTVTDVVNGVWDEALTSGTHNVTNSGARRLRFIQEGAIYSDGAIYIDTVNGTAGTTDYENGTPSNPVLTLADALTLAGSLGIDKFQVAPGSTITFGATDHSNETWLGEAWTLSFGTTTNVAGIYIQGATISGVMAGTGTTQVLKDCMVGATSLIAGTHVLTSAIQGTQTVIEAGDIFYDRCHSGVAGTGTPVFNVGAAILNTNLNIRNYSGGVELQNFGAAGTDNCSLEGRGQLVLNANCTGGMVALRGHFTITDNAGGAVTLSDDARYDTTQVESAVWNGVQSSYTTAGTFGEIATEIAGIKTTTDQFVFTVANQVDANALTGGGGDDAATIYTYFTAGSNEDAFKADVSALALQTTSTAILNDTAAMEPLVTDMYADLVTDPSTGNLWLQMARSLMMSDTTIATLASQTSFTLTNGSADDDAYNDCIIVIEDADTPNLDASKAVGVISDYTGATKTVTLLADPGIFTMAATDRVYIFPPSTTTGAGASGDVTSILGTAITEANAGNVANNFAQFFDVNPTSTNTIDDVGGGGGSGGSVIFTFNVDDGANPLEGVQVWVTTDAAGSNLVSSGYTDTLGDVQLSADPGTYYLWKQLAGYNFTNPTSVVVTA